MQVKKQQLVGTRYGPMDWFKIGKGVRQGCILPPCLFNVCAEYIMQNAGLDESQAGIKIAGRNINSLRYTNVTTLMAERKDKLKSLLMRVKEESEKVGLMTCVPIASWQTEGEKVEAVTDFIFLGSRITVDGDCKP